MTGIRLERFVHSGAIARVMYMCMLYVKISVQCTGTLHNPVQENFSILVVGF